ncbi:hypothetical protein Tco_1464144, partial [Tanacetum coccineum]
MKPKRKDIQIPRSSGPTKHVADEAVYKELDDSLVRAATTASSLKVEQDSGGGPRRVKKLEQKKRSRTHRLKRLHKVGMSRRVVSSGDEEDLGEDASKQGRRINAIDADEEITLVKQEVAAKGVNLTVDEVTLAQALAALKSVKPNVVTFRIF